MTGIELSVYGILNLIAPFVISILKSVSWPRWRKCLLALTIAIGVGAAVPFLQGGVPTLGELVMSILGAIGIQQALYALFVEKSKAEDKLRKIGIR